MNLRTEMRHPNILLVRRFISHISVPASPLDRMNLRTSIAIPTVRVREMVFDSFTIHTSRGEFSQRAHEKNTSTVSPGCLGSRGSRPKHLHGPFAFARPHPGPPVPRLALHLPPLPLAKEENCQALDWPHAQRTTTCAHMARVRRRHLFMGIDLYLVRSAQSRASRGLCRETTFSHKNRY